MDNDTKKTVDGKLQTPQTDRKLTANSLAQTDHQPTGKSVGTDLAGYVKTDQVAKIIGVTKPAVEKWRKLGWFRADLVDHNGVYWYTAEHVEQLKAVYRRDWQKAWTGAAAHDSEKKSVPELFAEVEKRKTDWKSRAEPTKLIAMTDYFAHHLKADIDALKNYANRLTGFDNLDRLQTFNPGLYVIGATPAAGKTTFCWQLLEQLAERGEKCIYCSYEMGVLELFTKTAARKLFLRDRQTNLTAAEIRRGGWSAQLDNIVEELGNAQTDLQILSLQDESIDDLLSRLKPLCADKAKAPMVCLDYLQIVPTSRDSIKLGVDDSVRKLKKFQRDTNTTFIVISSFNRANYTQTVFFESFKESGNIEYTADVVWALQLNILNAINPGNISEARKKIEAAKKQQPRQIQFKCLKNRQGTNYECFFKYYSAHDCFEPCTKADFKLNDSADNNEYDID